MDKEIIFLVEEDIESGYNARALGLPIFTQAESIDRLKENIRDAIRCHYDSEDEIPKVIRLHIVKEEMLSYA